MFIEREKLVKERIRCCDKCKQPLEDCKVGYKLNFLTSPLIMDRPEITNINQTIRYYEMGVTDFICSIPHVSTKLRNKFDLDYHLCANCSEKFKEWLKMLKEEKIDGRKKYDEKEHYDFLCNNLEERITNRKTTVTEIIDCGWTK